MSDASSPAPADSPASETPVVAGTDPIPAAVEPPKSDVVLENAEIVAAPVEQPTEKPIDAFVHENANVEPAAAEPAPNSSPNTGTIAPAAADETAVIEPSSEVQKPAEPPEETVVLGGGQETAPEQPAPLLAAPTIQPPLPGPFAFDEHGKPGESTRPVEKKATYVDADGVKHPVTVVAQRKDGSVDIMMPATVGGYRRDAVQRKQEADQVGDYIE